MLKGILELKGVSKLKKNEQRNIKGGLNCTVFTAAECAACNGFHLPNGCCVVDAQGDRCLGG